VDGSFTRRFGGLGIGLTLARELIDLLGGSLDLDSALGIGTAVRVRVPGTLPAAAPVPARAVRSAVAESQLSATAS
jgi:signal transduction histidine kinase